MAYVSLVTTIGSDVDVLGENAHPRLPLNPNLDSVLGRVYYLALCLEALAMQPVSRWYVY